MAQFTDAIAYQLKRWDHNHGTGGNLGWQYYKDMAWGGLADYPDPNDDSKTLFYNEFDDYLDGLVENIDENTKSKKREEIKERILNTNIEEKINDSESSQNGIPNSCQ